MRDLNKYDDFMDFLGDAFGAFAVIGQDEKLRDMLTENAGVALIVTRLCKEHREEVAEIVAAARGETVEEFRANYTTTGLMRELVRLISNPDVAAVFRSVAAMRDEQSSATV